MKRRKTPDLKQILPGDFIHLTVPENRLLEAGVHKATVVSLAAKDRRFRREDRYTLALELDKETQFQVFFQFAIPRDPHFYGHGFLGREEWPVAYSHEPNLERRLAKSLPALQGERFRGDD